LTSRASSLALHSNVSGGAPAPGSLARGVVGQEAKDGSPDGDGAGGRLPGDHGGKRNGRLRGRAPWSGPEAAAALDPKGVPMSRPSGWVEVWEEGGVWHWMYRDPEEDVALLGNRTYPVQERAVAAAQTAYPGIPVQKPDTADDHLAARTLAATALGALGAGATLAIRRRRDRRGGPV
jgi:hypothetical protein